MDGRTRGGGCSVVCLSLCGSWSCKWNSRRSVVLFSNYNDARVAAAAAAAANQTKLPVFPLPHFAVRVSHGFLIAGNRERGNEVGHMALL